MRRLAAIVLALGLFASFAAPARACGVVPRGSVVLYGGGDDPAVLLWSSRFNLRAYHRATFDEAQSLVQRAQFVRAGTRARIVGCMRGFVRAPYGLGLDDAVEVRILSGPLRGKSGWISGSDIRFFSSRSRDRTRRGAAGSRPGAARAPS
ncbi:MAG: hypothetical protein ACREMP_08230 [Candidatus Tyrphobacter sp.]